MKHVRMNSMLGWHLSYDLFFLKQLKDNLCLKS